ncbi:MAG TPA: hypothetical protein VGN82_25605 [Bosea sp. (in: a-proteobacteria)]|jgi:hypothetical protein|uniref:hypothetical protein n=1 Tax=Bosea sp. (in: a-proteobacteria) TaxID=1871050 RepID=UPI002E1648E4|nr:hypothetical protein [Bosea sp. (in: a-proteobacteria)]
MKVAGAIAMLLPIGIGGGVEARELAGRFGYLGEWDVAAVLSEEKAGGASAAEFAGSLLMKHNAVCGPGETPEKAGHIRMSVRGKRYSAQMSLAGSSCSFSGTLSETAHTFVTCGGEGQIPLRLWFKEPGSAAAR